MTTFTDRAPDSKPPGIWVGDVGICDQCAGLTVRGSCSHCRSGSTACMVPTLPEQARLRPSLVVVVEPDEDTTALDITTAVLPVPADVSATARRVAEEMAMRANVRLLDGDTLDFSLHRVAGGRDSIAADLDHTLDRKTVARALAELVERGVLDRVGRLDGWMDMEAEGGPRPKLGAYVYALNVTCRKLGARALQALSKRANRAVQSPSPLTATVRGTAFGKRIGGCLSAAIGRAQVGTRNAWGHWLACRCTDVGLTEGEAMKVLNLYRANVSQNPSYTAREAVATVRSRYKRLGRLA